MTAVIEVNGNERGTGAKETHAQPTRADGSHTLLLPTAYEVRLEVMISQVSICLPVHREARRLCRVGGEPLAFVQENFFVSFSHIALTLNPT